jgi:hypothetical protein
MDRPAAKVRGAVVPWWELPGEAACLAAAANDPALAAYHVDGEPLVARAMLHELERIMHPSRALNTVRACVLPFPIPMMGRAFLLASPHGSWRRPEMGLSPFPCLVDFGSQTDRRTSVSHGKERR